MKRGSILALLLGVPWWLSAQRFDLEHAQPGRCYVQCLVSDRYEWVSENVVLRPEQEEQFALPPLFATQVDSYLVRPAYVRLRVVDPVWEEEDVRVLLSPAGRRVAPEAYEAVQETIWVQPPARLFAVGQPLWDTVQVPVEIEPGHRLVEVLPMRYQLVPQNIEVRPPGRRWVRKKAAGGCLEADPEGCVVWCLVEVPAQTQVIYRQEPMGCDGEDGDDCVRYTFVPAKTVLKSVERLKEPARASEYVEPGKFQVVTRWRLRPGQKEPVPPAGVTDEYLSLRRKVLRREAYVQMDTVPAKYAPVERKILVRDGDVAVRTLPAEYTTVLKRKLVRSGGYWSWREVLCEEKIARLNIRQIQEVLKVRGYYEGRIDGQLNAQTRAAITRFQLENDLPADGNIDVETLQALGIGG